MMSVGEILGESDKWLSERRHRTSVRLSTRDRFVISAVTHDLIKLIAIMNVTLHTTERSKVVVFYFFKVVAERIHNLVLI